MKMEKRALMAFVASILLFLAYDALYLSPRVEKQRERRAVQLERQQVAADSIAAVLGAARAQTETGEEQPLPAGDTEQAPSRTEADRYQEEPASDSATSGLPSGTSGRAAEFTVVSGLYEITLSTTGAEIVSVRLLAYETLGEPVELIPQDAEWTYARTMNVSLDGQAASVSLGSVDFDAYRDGLGEPLLNGSKITVDPSREHTEIVFRASQNGNGVIERYYRFYPGQYTVDAGVRFATASYPSVTSVSWGMGPGLRSTEANVQDDRQNFKASVKLGEDIHRLKPGDFGKESRREFSGTLQWSSLQTKYFMAALIPPEPTRATVIVSGNKQEYRVSGRVTVPAVERQGRVDNLMRMYLGPIDYKGLKALGVGLESNVEMGWSLLRPVSWVVLWSLTWTYKFIPNYGLVIIIISVLTKVMFFRLTHKSFKSMKDLQALQPRIQAIKEKHGDDRQKVSQETMKMYKEAGVNPLGGCLPMLLQMPVFIALFQVLRNTIELRQAPFVGWINDLAQQDVLFTLPMSLPLVGDAFSLLPLLMGASMFIQTKIGGSLTGSAGAQNMPKGFNTMLPIVFTFLFYKMPSGLVIYWIINTVLSVAQQYYIHREPSEPKEDTAKRPAPAQKRRKKSKER
jgi:YidC/Oxa1 family membrane protein insertase